jgi:hypothetical protein
MDERALFAAEVKSEPGRWRGGGEGEDEGRDADAETDVDDIAAVGENTCTTSRSSSFAC